LENQLKELEKQIAQFESELQNTQSQKNTLANKIKTLKTEQAKLQAQIQSTNVLIDNLEGQIAETQDSISAAQNKADRLKAQISETIFSLYESDGKSLAASLAGDDGLAGFFKEVDNTQKLSETLTSNLQEMKKVKAELEKQNSQLEDQQEGAKELLSIKALQSNDLSSKLNEQGTLLSQTKGKEAQYNAILNDKKKAAAQIRNEIYGLAGGTTSQVTFGEALDIANSVSKLTGVRAAFLLAILTQETNLGKNVGTCNRAGDPPSKSWKVVMKPTRDQEPFKTITAELGLDIDTTAISCPMKDAKGNQVGWGGAMGPAQFIPSTWMGYRAKVTALTGKPANPWDIRDAFIASAIKLKADGATKGGNGEWEAAMKYFSGSTNTRFRFYGDNVLAIAKKYQTNIDALNQ
jgi:membrane-bound lytic murein transglycosylase B